MKLFKRRSKPVCKSRRRNVLETLETRKLFAADLGSAPEDMLATPYAFVGDHSPSNSEKWSMQVGQTTLQASGFGEVERQRLSLEKGKSYPITVSHIDTNIEEDGEKKPDYDYRAWIDSYASPAWTSGPTTPSGRDFFVDNSSGLLQKKFWGDDTNEATGTAMLHVPLADLDIDSDNSGSISSQDDWVELLATDGRLVDVLAGDIDEDGVEDRFDFDGIAGASFEPVTLSLSENLNYAVSSYGIDVTFAYDAASLSNSADGAFRLWKVDASADRSSGMMINPGQSYSASSLGLSPGSSATFYLEAVRASRRTKYFDSIEVTVDVSGYWNGTLEDTVHARGVMPPQGNLTFTTHTGTVVSESDEDFVDRTSLPACGCLSTLTVSDLNEVAEDGSLTISYSSETIQLQDANGNPIESGRTVDTDVLQDLKVRGVAPGEAIIELMYAGRAGVRQLDTIRLTVPDHQFELDLRVAAFIPLSKGGDVEWNGFIPRDPALLDVNWAKEPIPVDVNNPTWFFATDDRENAGDPGTSRIAVNGSLNTAELGQLQGSGPIFSPEQSESHRVLVQQIADRDIADGRTVEVVRQTPPTSETITDLGGYASSVQISASAGYPFAPFGLAPNIDFDVKFEVRQMDDCSIVVTVSGTHDAFPAYEVMVHGMVVYSYLAPGEEGPNPGNLNTTLTIPARSVRLPVPGGS
ncbi:MAG: hypothetical protein AAGD07_00525 [Planctomycetota bacterium]